MRTYILFIAALLLCVVPAIANIQYFDPENPAHVQFIEDRNFAPPWDFERGQMISAQLQDSGDLQITLRWPSRLINRPIAYSSGRIYNQELGEWTEFDVPGSPIPGLVDFVNVTGPITISNSLVDDEGGLNAIAVLMCTSQREQQDQGERTVFFSCGCRSPGDCGYWNVQLVAINVNQEDLEEALQQLPEARIQDPEIEDETNPQGEFVLPQDPGLGGARVPGSGRCEIPFGGPSFACPDDIIPHPDAQPPYVRFQFNNLEQGQLFGIPRGITSNSNTLPLQRSLTVASRYHPFLWGSFLETSADPVQISITNAGSRTLWNSSGGSETIDWVAYAPRRLFEGDRTYLQTEYTHPSLRTEINELFVHARSPPFYTSRDELDTIQGIRIRFEDADNQNIRLEHNVHARVQGASSRPPPDRVFRNDEIVLQISSQNMASRLQVFEHPAPRNQLGITPRDGEYVLDDGNSYHVDITNNGITLRMQAKERNNLYEFRFDGVDNGLFLMLNFTPESRAPSSGSTVSRTAYGQFQPTAIAFTTYDGGWFLGARDRSGGIVHRSVDGVVWNRVENSPEGVLQLVSLGDTVLATGRDGAWVTSDAGATWVAADSGLRIGVGEHVVASGGYFVHVPSLRASTDGLGTSQVFGNPPTMRHDAGVARPHSFAAASGNDAVVQVMSTKFHWNGQRWQESKLSLHSQLIYSDGYVAISGLGRSSGRGTPMLGPIATSPDGTDWTRQAWRIGNEGREFFRFGRTTVNGETLYSRGSMGSPASAYIGSGNSWRSFPLVSRAYAYGNGLVVGSTGVRGV